MEDKESLQASALVCLMRIEQINLLTERKELPVVVFCFVLFFLTENKWNWKNVRQVTDQFSDPVQNNINELLSNSVVSTSIVVGSIFFASYQLLWVKQLSVGASPNLICNKKYIYIGDYSFIDYSIKFESHW